MPHPHSNTHISSPVSPLFPTSNSGHHEAFAPRRPAQHAPWIHRGMKRPFDIHRRQQHHSNVSGFEHLEHLSTTNRDVHNQNRLNVSPSGVKEIGGANKAPADTSDLPLVITRTQFESILQGADTEDAIAKVVRALVRPETQKPYYAEVSNCSLELCPDIRKNASAIEGLGAMRLAQLILARMLRLFTLVCMKHNIPYWLLDETLISALRFRGFAPWDAGVHVGILAKDLDRLRKAAQEHACVTIKAQGDLDYFNTVVPARIVDDASCYLELHHSLQELRVAVGSHDHVDTSLSIDVYLFEVSDDRHVLHCTTGAMVCWLRSEMKTCSDIDLKLLTPLKLAQFEGFPVAVPGHSKSLLSKTFGSNWQYLPREEERYPSQGWVDPHHKC